MTVVSDRRSRTDFFVKKHNHKINIVVGGL